MADLLDSYSESNYSTSPIVGNGTISAVGQSFACSVAGKVLDSVKLFLFKVNSPTGNAVAKLYSHSGTYGTSSVPNTLLATSDNFDVSTLTTTGQGITFNFTGANRVALNDATNYVIVVEYLSGTGTHYVKCEGDNTSPSHGGNYSSYNGSWSAVSTLDLCFYVYGASPAGKGGLTLLNVG